MSGLISSYFGILRRQDTYFQINNTVFGQLLTLLPRHEFDAEARGHQRGQRLRVMSRWAQFVALGLGQLASRQSLRENGGAKIGHSAAV